MENKTVHILFQQFRDYSVHLAVIGVYADEATAIEVARGLSVNPDMWSTGFKVQEWQVEG